MTSQIIYSAKYYDETHEYRHVILPRSIARSLTRDHLMSETEWRRIGVQMSRGWEHYMWHRPEPHVLLFKRPLNDPGAPAATPDQPVAEPGPAPPAIDSKPPRPDPPLE